MFYRVNTDCETADESKKLFHEIGYALEESRKPENGAVICTKVTISDIVAWSRSG